METKLLEEHAMKKNEELEIPGWWPTRRKFMAMQDAEIEEPDLFLLFN